MGTCICIKNRKPEESDVWSSNQEYFNRQQLEELTVEERTSFDIQLPNNEFLHTNENDESAISPSLEPIFSEPVGKTFPINERFKTSQRTPVIELNQLPPKRSSGISPAIPYQRKTTDESVDQCIVLNSSLTGN
jgi:hypothetical protein